MAADRHEPRAGAPNVPARQCQVDEGEDVIGPAGMLGHPHRPDEHRALGRRVHRGEARHVRDRGAAPAREILERCRLQGRAELVESARVLAHEALVHTPRGDERLQRAVQERGIATGVHGEEFIGHLRAEDSALRV